MHEAFVLSTPVRRAVFVGIAGGESDLRRVVAKNRLIRPAAERAAAELAERGLVKEDGGKWTLTPEGEELRASIGREHV